MKKKIFLTLAIVMVLTCLFAIGVSAEEMNPEYNADYVKTMTSNMTTVELEDGTSVPLYDAQGYTLAYYWDDVTSATRTLKSVRTKDLTFNFSGTKLSSIYYGDEHLAGTAKAGKIVVLNLRGVKNSEGKDITDFNGDNMFKEDSPLQHIFMPDSIATLVNYAFGFRDGSLSHLIGCYFSENSQLTSIPASMFQNCFKLKGFYIPKGVTSIGQAFLDCRELFFVEDDSDFATRPNVYNFPAALESISGETFKFCPKLNQTLVFGKKLTAVTNGFAFGLRSASDIETRTIVFQGLVEEIDVASQTYKTMFVFANEAQTTSNFTLIRFQGSNNSIYICSSSSYSTNGGTSWSVDETKHMYVVQKNEAPTCTKPGVNGTACFCGKPNPDSPSIPAQHDYNKTLSYNAWAWENDNYFANAHYVHVCQVCAEEYAGAEIENSHLFIKEGYSYTQTENKKDETVVSFDFQYSIKVNQTAMTLYTEQTGNVVKYGTVAGVKDDLSNPLTYVDGVLTVGESAAASDMTGTDYVKLLIKVAGIPVNENGIEISCNAYAIIDNKLKYLSDGNVRDSAFVSTIK